MMETPLEREGWYTLSASTPSPDGPVWIIHQGLVILASVIGRNRGWVRFRSGGFEWNTQAPTIYDHESDGYWFLLRRNVMDQRWHGWAAKESKRSQFDGLDAATERMYEASCRYHRACITESEGKR